MQIGSFPSYASLSAVSGDAEAAKARKADAAFEALFADDTPEAMIKEITEGGIEGMLKWKVRQLEKQIAGKVLASEGITKEEIAALPPEQRIPLQQRIMDEVARKLKEAMDEQMKRESGMAALDTYDPLRLDQQRVDITA